MTSPTLLNGANNSGIAANGGNSVFAGGRKELAMRLLSMPSSSQSPSKTANNGQEEEIKIGIPIGGNSSFGDSFQEDQHSMIRLI